jgi:UDP-galactopyranose mutase
MAEYDYLIVGAGLFGAVFAREATRRGKRCLVIDKREHTGGNIYNQTIEGINVHVYGAHIFHTNDKDIWDYVNQFVTFNRYTNSPIANFKGDLYNLPFNMNTFRQLWGITTPEAAKTTIAGQVAATGITHPANLEEQALSLVGKDLYEILIKGYSEKHWGRKATELPAFLIKRLPLRFTFDNNYFNDDYQGIPVGGYNQLTEGLLKGIEVQLSVDYLTNKGYWDSKTDKIVYTGKIDAFYDFRFGKLEYRSLRFEHKLLEQENYQGNAVINYTDADTPYTRTIEHKHFAFGKQANTVVSWEYPEAHTDTNEPFYPVNDTSNMQLLKQYQLLAAAEPNTIFGGRLAEFRYYDMHQVIAAALKKIQVLFADA